MISNPNRTRRDFLGLAKALAACALTRSLAACLDEAPPDDGLEAYPERRTTRADLPRSPTDDDEYLAPTPGEPAEVSNAAASSEATAKARALEAKNVGGRAYTFADPGPFPGKERSHIPLLVVRSDRVAVIKVAHVMDAGSASIATQGTDAGLADATRDASVADVTQPSAAHWVTTIFATDENGRVVYFEELLPTDEAPPSVAFLVPAGVAYVRAFAHCNLHGLWTSDQVRVP